jgi:hypothetical protein
MSVRRAAFALVAALLLAAPAWAVRNVTDPGAPRALPAEGPVQVSWHDPAGFTEIRRSRNRAMARRGDWVAELACHLRQRAQARLPTGERLEVVLVDIARAGEYEAAPDPALGDVRIYRDVYPPAIELSFRRLDADGRVRAEGTRRLRDPGYLLHGASGGDPLRFEKRLLDDWLARELPR